MGSRGQSNVLHYQITVLVVGRIDLARHTQELRTIDYEESRTMRPLTSIGF